MDFKNILLEIDEKIAVITLNRPEVRNALDYETWDEIRAAVKQLRANNDVRVVIFTGAGGKAFASGADIASLQKRTVREAMESETNDILNELAMLNKPVIAAIDGYALGGGCELAMACDIRVATKKSKFGQPEVNLGIIAGAGGTQRLQRLVGIGKAKELIFTGEIIDAAEAERIGLINKVVEDGEGNAMAAALEMANKIKDKGPVAIILSKMCMNVGQNTDLNSALYFDRYAQTIAFATEDKMEGTSAFLEKRKPEYKNK